MSPESLDLIRRLLCDEKDRLGSIRGASEIKEHAFFNGIDFRQVERHEMQALWKPPIGHCEDTSNFDFDDGPNCGPISIEDEPLGYDNDDENGNQFYGFTFRRFLTNGGPPPQFFQGENSSASSRNSTNSNSAQCQVDGNGPTGQGPTSSDGPGSNAVYV